MASAPSTRRERYAEFAFGLGLVCLLGMVPVTLGALAGFLSLAAAVPVLCVAMAFAILSLVATK